VERALELARGHLVLTRGADGQEDPDALLRLAEVHNRRGAPREALSCADRARGMHRERGSLTGVARSEMVRANALDRLDRLEEALGAFTEAGVLFDASGWDADALYAQIRQAVVLHALGRYLEAARLNKDLTVRYLARPGDEVTARWCLARLLDNLFEAHDYAGILATFDEFAPAWPEGAGVGEAVYRECLGFRAAALEELGESARATALADEVIAATPAREASVATALCFEIRARSSSDESRASQDLAHAIALHVARGKEARARQLSEHFLAEEGMDPGRGKPVG
jgi:tetratricopeptide (TPR) repeat protein